MVVREVFARLGLPGQPDEPALAAAVAAMSSGREDSYTADLPAGARAAVRALDAAQANALRLQDGA